MTDDAMMPPASPDDATRRQMTAADPGRSTWLTANAGSGKTRVLTDRVARLLLDGTRPERVLCLTYTKAAATEMQNRLLKRLGEWAMLGDADLRRALTELGVAGAPDLNAARRLFAQAIEAPGGLKVQTIHSFCAALLRRFPLEAGVPHGFTELDDRSATLLRDEVLEEMAAEDPPEMGDLTAIHSGDLLDGLLAQVTRGFDAEAAARSLSAQAGLSPDLTAGDLLSEVFLGGEAAWVRDLTALLAGGGSSDAGLAKKLQSVRWGAPRLDDLAVLEGALLFGAKAAAPFAPKIDKIPTKKLRDGPCAALMPDLNALMERVAETRPRRIALQFVERSEALRRFGREFSRRYEARKAAMGWLDFDDLIARSARLLSDATMAQWVLFRLDGGIDHILVDEAQDTSPEQWRVVERLTAEFTAGDSDRLRTLFVVGDPKQSIYSFQGADIAVFEARRDGFAADFAAVKRPMQQLDLEYSFRSSPAILTAVDATFRGAAGEGLGQAALHRAFLAERPGRVDLWPVIDAPDKQDEPPWEDPVDQLAPDSAPTRLAEEIARQVKAMLDPVHGASIATRDGVRRVGAGDILILVQGRRSALFGEIIRALKAAELPVAGADRLKLAAELAVKDIRAMLNFLATPEDDLSLAGLLRSPLIGLDEDALYRLAHGRRRGEYLWERLRHSDQMAARDLLGDMLDHAAMRPFELISRLLNRHGGREKLLARLGPEAEDGIDELVTQALAYERTEVPSLTGFLVWLSADDVEVRRQPGAGVGLIRVMTVHGSKGLESPIVILPDTKKRNAYRPPEVLRPKDGLPILTGRSDVRPDFAQDMVDTAARLDAEERKRLLYVAMTRAESWLIVATAGDPGVDEESWYAMIEQGLSSSGLEEETLEGGLGPIRRYGFGDWPEAAPARRADVEPPAPADWLWQDPPPVAPRRKPRAASALGGAKALPGPDGDDPDTAMLMGTRLHLMLEHLPDADRRDWPMLARDILAGSDAGLPDEETLSWLLREAGAVLDAPALTDLFTPGPDAHVLREVDLAVSLPGAGPIRGVIDRLIVAPDRVSVIDYKSNATVPDRPEATPQGILRQMAAYRAALRGLYPGREIATGLIWTVTRELMWLPDPVLDRAMAALDPARQAT
ncbi:DNA helicase/exodeoxyribonuclease V, subunit A [Paracoccus isoporae]|uniref:DNA 3'-5' helicase n=1 Tax=Paracoccus isoporae TaxID=591205 RepID=A0A1G6UWI1_9RHOB|nr:double-strand break repair helicase AddA [Paracoccus isoporae]SDD45682.1 DNA helicase/exodeoxyribonuclease V, subunit A [Paracoccus isoporae]